MRVASRRRGGGMRLLPLLISAALSAAPAGREAGLDCTNDYEERMICHFKTQNCSEYNLTVWIEIPDEHEEEHCVFQECETGLCCCTVQLTLVKGETHNATVWKANEPVESRLVHVTSTVKVKAPTITSVNESNGNIQLRWKTNIHRTDFTDELAASVTYYKKGDTKKVTEHVELWTIDGENYYEILGRNLEPSTTYVVSVQSYMNWSGKFSDSSNEWEFTTAASSHLRLGVIVGLSIAAVIFTSAAFGCYYKFKSKWEVVGKCPKPKLLDIHPGTVKILQPLQTNLASVTIDLEAPANSKPRPEGSLTDTGSLQQCSRVSRDASPLRGANINPADIKAGVQDALSKVFTHLKPLTSGNTSLLSKSNKGSDSFASRRDVGDDDSRSYLGPTDCENMTYFIPGFTDDILTESFDAQTHSAEGNIVACPDKQVPLTPSDTSYQQPLSANSAHAEDSNLSPINIVVSREPVPTVESAYKSFDEVVSGATVLNGKT